MPALSAWNHARSADGAPSGVVFCEVAQSGTRFFPLLSQEPCIEGLTGAVVVVAVVRVGQRR